MYVDLGHSVGLLSRRGVFSNAIYRNVAFEVYLGVALTSAYYADLRALPSAALRPAPCSCAALVLEEDR